MSQLFKKNIFKYIYMTLLFGAVYSLITFLFDGVVEIDKVLTSMFFYFLILCLLGFVAPKFRKITGHDKANND